MADKIQLRRDTTVNWTSANPTLSAGEIGIDTTLKQFKIGDGVTTWANLVFYQNSIIKTVLTTYSVLVTDDTIMVNNTSTSVSIYLFTPIGHTGKILRFKKISNSAFGVTVMDISSGFAYNINNYNDYIEIQSDGATWRVIAYTNAMVDARIAAQKNMSYGIAGLDPFGDILVTQLPNNIGNKKGQQIADGIVTALTFSGLDILNDGGIYEIVVTSQAGGSGFNGLLNMYVNGDLTASHYMSAAGATLVASTPGIGMQGAYATKIRASLYLQTAGLHPQLTSIGQPTSTISAISQSFSLWTRCWVCTEAVANITSLTFTNVDNSVLVSGLTISIYKMGGV